MEVGAVAVTLVTAALKVLVLKKHNLKYIEMMLKGIIVHNNQPSIISKLLRYVFGHVHAGLGWLPNMQCTFLSCLPNFW